jgi:hypothetical protein
MKKFRKRMRDFTAEVLRRPVIWAIGCYVEYLRRKLPEVQRIRAESDGSSFWAGVSENSRGIVNAWDRITELLERQSLHERPPYKPPTQTLPLTATPSPYSNLNSTTNPAQP